MKKHILQENYERFFGKREFGDPLPTFKDVMETHKVKINEVSDKDVESYVKKKGLKGMDLPFWKVGITYPFYPTKYHYVRAATAKLAEKQLQKMYNRESGGKFGKAVFDDNYFLKVNKNLKEGWK